MQSRQHRQHHCLLTHFFFVISLFVAFLFFFFFQPINTKYVFVWKISFEIFPLMCKHIPSRFRISIFTFFFLPPPMSLVGFICQLRQKLGVQTAHHLVQVTCNHWHLCSPIFLGEEKGNKSFYGIRKVILVVVIVHRNAAFFTVV